MENKCEIENFIENLIKQYNYSPLNYEESCKVRQYYKENIPPYLSVNGGNALYSKKGIQICKCYNRIILTDYGAFIEIENINAFKHNYVLEFGEQWRVYDKRYKDEIDYIWLTTYLYDDMKIYYYKRLVSYGDFRIGCYYIPVWEVYPLEKLDVKPIF